MWVVEVVVATAELAGSDAHGVEQLEMLSSSRLDNMSKQERTICLYNNKLRGRQVDSALLSARQTRLCATLHPSHKREMLKQGKLVDRYR